MKYKNNIIERKQSKKTHLLKVMYRAVKTSLSIQNTDEYKERRSHKHSNTMEIV